ncbi:elongation factor G [Carboxydochorda subterranea]|uniref:Elongation factor G n=1 Tax=Carboxydichorda subterranea TaxID=3109565 RepID=A0ABZ1C0Y2_9FIRM|nr:elongation factor G [Limnochorda sp. L945t]WRP18543.1 elongation factor G [Limnochorda sp. L945t]
MAVQRVAAERIRNVALIGHGGAGKTSLAEAMLFVSGSTSRLGSVDQGTAATDYDPEEVRRHISIQAAVAAVEWEGHRLNVVDTPGYFDFAAEVVGSLRVVEGAVLVLSAPQGVEVGSEQVWAMAEHPYEGGRPVARLCFVNKMDRENASFGRTFDQLHQLYGTRVVAVQIPMGEAEHFQGIIDLVEMKAYRVSPKGFGEEPSDIPAEWQEQAATWRDRLVEAVAATDDELTAKFLEEQPIEPEEMRRALRHAVHQGTLTPVACGSATRGAGVRRFMRLLVDLLPSPEDAGDVVLLDAKSGEVVRHRARADGPLYALVFKTISDPYVGRLNLFRVYSGAIRSDSSVYNPQRGRDERIGQLFVPRGKEQLAVEELGPGEIGSVAKLQETGTGDTLTARDAQLRLPGIRFPEPVLTMAVHPKSRGDEDKISSGLARLAEEDPSVRVEKSGETGQILISGMGELHLEVMTSRLQKKFGVEVELVPPRVPYRETIRSTQKAEGKYKKQTGGRGQYGHVFLELAPLEPGKGFEFVDRIFGGAVPRQYIPAVEKGVRETCAEGVLAGYPVVDIQVALYDGSYHPVDSSEMAFKIAASMAFKKAFMEANPVLLEPILSVEVEVPEAAMGDVIAELNKKRGRILGMEARDSLRVIRAQAPMAEMFRFAVDLRSITQGRGRFKTEFDHYEEVPAPIAQQVIEAAQKERQGA